MVIPVFPDWSMLKTVISPCSPTARLQLRQARQRQQAVEAENEAGCAAPVMVGSKKPKKDAIDAIDIGKP